MAAKRNQKQKTSIFEGIRKPTAPPSKKLGDAKPEEKIHPSGRKAKHKPPKGSIDNDVDI